jgi:alpha-glucuronidase
MLRCQISAGVLSALGLLLGATACAPSSASSTAASAGAAGTSAGQSSSGGTPAASTGGSPPSMGGAGAGTLAGNAGQTAAGGSETYPKPSEPPADEDGSSLWLRYPQVPLPGRLAEYRATLNHVVGADDSATLKVARAELVKGLSGLTGAELPVADQPTGDGAVVLGTPESSAIVQGLALQEQLAKVGAEGYVIQAASVDGKATIVVAANSDVGVLHGVFGLLRHVASHRGVSDLQLSSAPKIQRRVLDHWDNMDGSVERGYSGKSLWDWGSLPGTISQRYLDYARANASIGVSGVVLNNVNSNAQILTTANLDKVAALATAFRPYGIAVYLSARFSAPIEIGGLNTADPTSSAVRQWWAGKADEIYGKIPDFGGFLVKANSEGQPGPQDYDRSHADGAKMLSDALAPHGGVVMWRAFVYSTEGSDRIRQAYDEFEPLDGSFGSNAILQVKNGPLDFQPREPFSALLGAMPNTPLALELQITKEYLGEDTHLAYLGTLFEEVLDSETHANGPGSTVARVIDGSADGHTVSAIAGVANVGLDANWSGSHFNQANWYAFGRLAWDPDLSAKDVAEEWARQTFSNDPVVLTPVTGMMMDSRQALVNYMTPLGLAHIMGTGHHYGPAPWVDNQSRADWNPVYYHRADETGIGFDRSASGSNAVEQYAATVRDQLANRASVPDDLLLFFHHVGWDEKLSSSGRTLWEELVHRYSTGVDAVAAFRNEWSSVEGLIDAQRYREVSDFLKIQHYEARWWRDACLQYFAGVSGHEIPAGYAAPAHNLQFYKDLSAKCPSDATKPRCSDIYTGEPSPAVLP